MTLAAQVYQNLTRSRELLNSSYSALQEMVPFRRLSGEHQHSVILDNVITCSGARSHSKRAAAKRDAGHKAAISHFGQVKLQLANPETVKKVKLSDSQGHSKTTGIVLCLVFSVTWLAAFCKGTCLYIAV